MFTREHDARLRARPTQVIASAVRAMSRQWFAAALLLIGLYAGLPWLAPVFMRLGWTGPGHAIYLMYSTQCHQMAQRSYFLFGPRLMYTMPELQTAGVALDPLSLRAFVGSPELGWKVAWSDRMTSMYSALFVSWIGVHLLRRRLPRLPIWAFVLLISPLVIDGTTHLISDLSGLGQGFRDTNAWLAAISSYGLPPSFYAGDAWGSFNSWIRLLSGVLFGLGVAWFAVPRLESHSEDDLLQAHPDPDASAVSPEGWRMSHRTL